MTLHASMLYPSVGFVLSDQPNSFQSHGPSIPRARADPGKSNIRHSLAQHLVYARLIQVELFTLPSNISTTYAIEGTWKHPLRLWNVARNVSALQVIPLHDDICGVLGRTSLVSQDYRKRCNAAKLGDEPVHGHYSDWKINTLGS